MKNNTFLSMALIGVLMVVGISCTTMQGAQDEYYEPASRVSSQPSRVYVDDPYVYGRTIVMERDPFTGRYYEVGTVGGYNRGLSTYDPRFDNNRRVYNNNRRYDNRRYNSGYPSRGQVVTQQPQRPTEADRQADEQRRREAKDAILGKKN